MLIVGDKLTDQDKIKQVVKNAFIYMKDNNLDFSPESYLEAFCKQAKLFNLNSNECNWYSRWSNKFDSNIKKELNNYPIKNRDDFINTLSSIINSQSSLNSTYCMNVLEKALKVLKNQKIIDIDPKLPLESIDKKLTDLLISNSNHLFNLMHSTGLLTKNDISSKAHLIDGYALICDICCFDSIKEQFGLEALEKLFNAFYRILLNSVDSSASIGVYEDSSIVILLPKCSIEMATKYSKDIEQAIKNSKFIYENRDIDIEIHLDLLPIKDLKL